MQAQEYTYKQNCICLPWYCFWLQSMFQPGEVLEALLCLFYSVEEHSLQRFKSSSEHKAWGISAQSLSDPCVRGESSIMRVGEWPERCSEFLPLLCWGVWVVFGKPKSSCHDKPFPLTNSVVLKRIFFVIFSVKELALLRLLGFQLKPRS